ncbi:prokaryotic cytochrome C oxidase subunit IV family protein [Mycolicibacterium litorale]|uniref:Prokaryotic cytochrome C oxidase subunit IV family protein n=1 Tax=Mycolicibacterium litorale TaxID=758802 RepID=A0A6S6P833_9MYCO|nr:cytochrome C oxidase subunit IV family protein [Mycolicibacterium litorale]BCI54272.1 prokaryotic cytochrome C oxidase subunit IV family protein [Mycolicibacterium litorale]
MATTPSHTTAPRRAITAVWLILVAITVASVWLAPAHVDGPPPTDARLTVAVVVLAVVKSRLIIRYFMEVRHAPRWLRASTDAWLFVLWAAILGVYLW